MISSSLHAPSSLHAISSRAIRPLKSLMWMAGLPLDSLVPLLQRVRLTPFAGRGFTEMLLEDNVPLLPSLTELVLVGTTLSARRTLHLCDALMKRVEQRVLLETLDLRTCFATSRAIELLSEIVVDVLSPDSETSENNNSEWHSEGRGHFLTGDVSHYILETDSEEDEDEMDDW
ncbi:hypothetical protein EDB85DRAFT_2014657 [Lactarius pseudohatsudake]|nr:hypothetical protein EDB85DRAFT_2014657 [Lactarius pseudohatsudake]